MIFAYNLASSFHLEARTPYLKDYTDVIIIEDDPYFFLQEGSYVPKAQRHAQIARSNGGEEEYISGLVPSFLRFLHPFCPSTTTF
jgi:hypothetical protein